MTMNTHFVQSGNVRLAAYTRGNPAHTPIIFIHGYPDDSHVWDPVAERLADDFYVITYDVRGAGQSDRPHATKDYRLDVLSADLVAVMDALIPGRAAHLVGHDWGSIQTWESVTNPHLESRIRSYTTLSGPCLDHVGRWMHQRFKSGNTDGIARSLKQLASSWYIMFFHLPLLAPLGWKLAGDKVHQQLARSEGLHYTPRPNGVADGMDGIRLYRANFISALTQPRERYTACPVQLIVQTRDRYVRESLFEDLAQWAPLTWRRDVDTTHWGLVAEGERLAHWVREFIQHIDEGTPVSGLRRL